MQSTDTGKSKKITYKQLHVSAEIHKQIRLLALTKEVTVNDIIKELLDNVNNAPPES